MKRLEITSGRTTAIFDPNSCELMMGRDGSGMWIRLDDKGLMELEAAIGCARRASRVKK